MFKNEIAQIKGVRGESSGRFVVASQALAEETEVLNEKPFVFGPKQSSQVVCIECCAVLQQIEDCCNDCELPCCSSCKQGGFPIHKPECQIFQTNNINFRGREGEVYPCITVLRLLLAGLQEFETHAKARTDTPVWVYNEKTVVPFITALKDTNGNFLFDQCMIHEATGALDTNCFHIQDKDVLGRSVFPTASHFNNSCAPNCYRHVSRTGISIKTSRPVVQGEELTICYTGLLTPKHIRQAVFKQTKHFSCQCSRCLDPSDGGTNPSALRCTSCAATMVTTSGEECSACPECGEPQDQARSNQMSLISDTLVNRLIKEEDCLALKSGLNKLSRMLSVHHFQLVKLKTHFIKHSDVCDECVLSEERVVATKQIKDLLSILNILEQNLATETARENQEHAAKLGNFLAEKDGN